MFYQHSQLLGMFNHMRVQQTNENTNMLQKSRANIST